MSANMDLNQQLSKDLLNFSSEIALNKKFRGRGEASQSISLNNKYSMTHASSNSAISKPRYKTKTTMG
jgi:hypothetical protein